MLKVTCFICGENVHRWNMSRSHVSYGKMMYKCKKVCTVPPSPPSLLLNEIEINGEKVDWLPCVTAKKVAGWCRYHDASHTLQLNIPRNLIIKPLRPPGEKENLLEVSVVEFECLCK